MFPLGGLAQKEVLMEALEERPQKAGQRILTAAPSVAPDNTVEAGAEFQLKAASLVTLLKGPY